MGRLSILLNPHNSDPEEIEFYSYRSSEETEALGRNENVTWAHTLQVSEQGITLKTHLNFISLPSDVSEIPRTSLQGPTLKFWGNF